MAAKRGAPVGNKNGAKNNRIWSNTVRRVAMRGKGQLEKLAQALINKALDGDIAALKEFGDRFEGKIPQAIEGTGEGGELIIKINGADRSLL